MVTGFSRSPGGVGRDSAVGAPIRPLPVLPSAAALRTGPASARRAGSVMARRNCRAALAGGVDQETVADRHRARRQAQRDAVHGFRRAGKAGQIEHRAVVQARQGVAARVARQAVAAVGQAGQVADGGVDHAGAGVGAAGKTCAHARQVAPQVAARARHRRPGRAGAGRCRRSPRRSRRGRARRAPGPAPGGENRAGRPVRRRSAARSPPRCRCCRRGRSPAGWRRTGWRR